MDCLAPQRDPVMAPVRCCGGLAPRQALNDLLALVVANVMTEDLESVFGMEKKSDISLPLRCGPGLP